MDSFWLKVPICAKQDVVTMNVDSNCKENNFDGARSIFEKVVGGLFVGYNPNRTIKLSK